MLPVEPLIRVSILLMVTVSGTLLGLSLKSFELASIALVGAVAGYLVTDHWRLFRLDGWLANIASVLILFLAMKDFLPGDSTGKLVSVATLLVYLQSVLMFQEKTPRLIWQILVLSLLQVVVAAIFSLNLEGGILFLFYFLISGITMALLSICTGNRETKKGNQSSASRLRLWVDLPNDRSAILPLQRKFSTSPEQTAPIIFFDAEKRSLHPLKPLMQHLSVWLLITFLFTLVMFYMIPRHTQPWFGSPRVEVASTGFSKSVDLRNYGEIRQSNQLIFRATFADLDSPDEKKQMAEPPYFRGMALPSLVIEEGRSNWRAPHDRVYERVYQQLETSQYGQSPILQKIILEENLDPLVYSVMPAVPSSYTPNALEFCHEISALTRCQVNRKLELAPFDYELICFLNQNGSFVESWPYVSNTQPFLQFPMSEDPLEEEWLTSLDPSRYPTLVGLSNRIVATSIAEHKEISRIDLVRAMERFFLEPGRFNYTMDFTTVKWNDDVDPIEDFVRNHRRGHCELFASALTLMLRSQGIPARLVVGFHGGDINKLNGTMMVRGRHAHAWVEAYLRPKDCTTEMLANGAAGPGGAWLRVDPTPPSPENNSSTVGNEAMELARTMWQDYVLGMNNEKQADELNGASNSFIALLQNMDFDHWQATFQKFEKSNQGAWLRYGLAATAGLLMLSMWLASLFSRQPSAQAEKNPQRRFFRRLVAGAIAIFSPSFGKWILAKTMPANSATRFYDRLVGMLRIHGLERQPVQTHREFAIMVGNRYSEHPLSPMIRSTVWEVSEIFNEVRFGNRNVPADLREQIDSCLNELESSLNCDQTSLDQA